MIDDSGTTNFGMQPQGQGAASDKERPEGSSMTDRQQETVPRSQQEVQMGEKAPLPGQRSEGGMQEQSYGTQAQDEAQEKP